jgi:hypothetical protein
MNYRIEKSMSVIRNLPNYLKASYVREGSAAKDYAMNRCLKHIELLQRVTFTDSRTSAFVKSVSQSRKDGILREAWEIYIRLQDFTGEERQDYNTKRTISLDCIKTDGLHEYGILQLEPEDEEVDSDSPDVRSGGLGYRSVNWKSAYFDPEHTGESRLGSYWQPPKKPMPCLVYTEEQIAGLNDGSLHFGDIEGSFEQIHS